MRSNIRRYLTRAGAPTGLLSMLATPAHVFAGVATGAVWLGFAVPGMQLLPGVGGAGSGSIAISLQSAVLGVDDSGRPTSEQLQGALAAIPLGRPGHAPSLPSDLGTSPAPRHHVSIRPRTPHAPATATPAITTTPAVVPQPQAPVAPSPNSPQPAVTAEPSGSGGSSNPPVQPAAPAVISPQTIHFSTSPPDDPVFNGAPYQVAAVADSSLPVSLEVDDSSAGVCRLAGGAVSFIGTGVCTIDANQPGNESYSPARTAQQSFTVGRASQSLHFTTQAPANPFFGGPSYSTAAAADSGLPVSISVDGSSSSVCAASGGVVTFIGVGPCTLDADQPGNANYAAAVRVQQTFTVGKSAQQLKFTSDAPANAWFEGSSYPVAASADSNLPVDFSIDPSSAGACTLVDGAVVPSGVGTCTVDADQPGNDDWEAAAEVQQTFAIARAQQTITFTSPAPTNAVYHSTYAVTATSSSNLPVVLSVDPSAASVCTIAGGTMSVVGVGTCTLDADQSGDAHYKPAPEVSQSFSVGRAAQAIAFDTVSPSHAFFGGPTSTVHATAGSGLPVTYSVDPASTSVCSVAGTTVSFVGVGTCTIEGDQGGNALYQPALRAGQSFSVAKSAQSISFTSAAPSSAFFGGPVYGVTATSDSGLPVSLAVDPASAAVCSLAGGNVSFVGVGTCTIDGTQAGDADYLAAADVSQSFSVGRSAQSITFTSAAPSNETYGGAAYAVAASADSGLGVSFSIDPSSAGVCFLTAGLVEPSGVGTCTVDADQAGDGDWLAAPEAQQSFTIGKASQAISFLSSAPTGAVYHGAGYAASAAADSGLPVTLSIDPASSAVCTLVAGTVEYVGVGTCTVDADQAGSGLYLAAPQVQQSFAVDRAPQTITFTSTAPANAAYAGATYAVTASSDSGLAVGLSVDPSSSSICSLSGGTVSFVGAGTCTLDGDQGGNVDFLAAPQAQQTFTVAQAAQTITFTTAAPSSAAFNGPAYSVGVSADSGLPVHVTVDPTSVLVCSVASNSVSFIGVGTCTLDADQSGDPDYLAAPQAQQTFAVGRSAQAITFTSPAPSNETYGGAGYAVAASADSGLGVSFSIDPGSAGVCFLAAGVVEPSGVGTCTVDADQAGDADYLAAPEVQQSFAIGKASQAISFLSSAPTAAVYHGAGYAASADSDSGLPVTLSVDPASSAVCSLAGGTFDYIGVGTCTVDADQAGSGLYNAAPQVQQSFSVGQASQTVTFTSTAPSNATFDGATYAVAASSDSGLAVALSVDASSSSICSLSGGTVSFVGAGTCTLDGDQAGNANFLPATEAQQTFTVAQAAQTITFTSSAPTSAAYGGAAYSVGASADSGLPVHVTVDPTSVLVCSVASNSVSFIGVGTCILDADQSGDPDYLAAPQAQQSFAVGQASQSIGFTSTAPSGVIYGDAPYAVTAAASSGLGVSLSIDPASTSVCSLSGSSVSYVGVGTCTVDADQAGNADYLAAPTVQQSFTVGRSPQTVSFTSTAPSSAVYAGATYAVGTSSTSGLPVSLSVDSWSSTVCAVSGTTVSFIGVGTCTIDADQAGNANYTAAAQVQQTFSVGQAAQTISFDTPAPGHAVFAGPAYTVSASSDSGLAVGLAVDAASAAVCSLSGSSVTFTGVGTCTLDATQAGDADYLPAADAQQSFAVGKGSQTVVFTTTAPSNAVVGGAAYAVAADSDSGLGVDITVDPTSSGICSISGGNVTFQTVGTCLLDADQSGDPNHDAAPEAQQSFTVARGSQTLSFTSTAPSSAKYGGTYNVTAASDAGLSVALSIDATSSGVCSILAGTVSFDGVGTCTVDADQAGNVNYHAASEVQQSFAIAKAPQTVTFTSTAPSNASVGGSAYGVSATSDSGLAVGLAVDGTSSAVCSLSGGNVSFQTVGTCTLDANQSGNAHYTAAGQVQQSFAVVKGTQSLNFTSTAPAGAVVGGSTYAPAATATSGLSVGLTVDSSSSSVCSISGGNVSFQTVGTCVVDADQAGNANWNAAAEIQQSFAVAKGTQTLGFTSTAPANASVGGAAYAVTASSNSGLTPSVTVDPASAAVCSVSGGNVTFQAVGTCIVDADQAGNANWKPATEIQQSFAVAKGTQTINFTTTAPSSATYNGAAYSVAASSNSGLAPVIGIDATSTSVCSLSGANVSFIGVGTCLIDADQAGNANWNAAAEAHQSFTVSKAAQTISFTSTAPSNAVYGGSPYSAAASSSSGLAVTLAIDPATSANCSVSAGTVSFTAAGTCTVDANQAGNGLYNAAPQAQQTFTIAKGSQTISFTSTAPTNAVYAGPTYTVAATATSGLGVSLAIDAGGAGICSLSGTTVSFIAPGTCTIDANQAGNGNFNAAAQAQQTFAVGKATPGITWSNPSDIVFGTSLSATQLNASASVPGTLTYTPTAGTVLQPGANTLGVMFTPTDSTDYASTSASVQINVTFTTPCTGGNIGGQTINSGQAICVTSGGKISGPVTINAGGALWISGGTITGPVNATSPSALTLCGTQVTGQVNIQNATGPIVMGNTASCTGNQAQQATIQNGTGGVTFVGNNIGSDVTITNNSGGFIFQSNTVGGNTNTTGNT